MTRRLTKKLNESRPALFTDGAPTIPVTVIGHCLPVLPANFAAADFQHPVRRLQSVISITTSSSLPLPVVCSAVRPSMFRKNRISG